MLTREEVVRTCDELHACIEQGPGERPDVLARCLSLLEELRQHTAAPDPLEELRALEAQLRAWFSPGPRADDEAARMRLLSGVSDLEETWPGSSSR